MSFDSDMRKWRDNLPPPARPRPRAPFEIQSSRSGFAVTRFRPSPKTEYVHRGIGNEAPVPTLLCDSVAASKTKCGFFEFTGYASTPPKRYLSRTNEKTGSWTRVGNPGGGCEGMPFAVATIDRVYTETYSVTPTGCSIGYHDCEGSGSLDTYTYTIIGGACVQQTHTPCVTTFSCAGWSVSCHCANPDAPIGSNGCCQYTCSLLSIATTTTATTQTKVFTKQTGTCEGHSGSTTETVTLSNEYTTALLKTNTVAALPAYAGLFNGGIAGTCITCGSGYSAGQSCCCSAYAHLSTNETSYTIRRFKHKFTLEEDAEADLDLRWKELFIPTLAAAVTYNGVLYNIGDADPNPSHWTYTERDTMIFEGFDESAIFTVEEPVANGTTTIACVEAKWADDDWEATTCWP